jgi:arylsulfatase A-like enzyme
MLTALFLACVLAVDPAAGREPPANVLVLLADDLGAERIEAYGDLGWPHGPTPVLNALAASGVLFRNAYANPVCSPTRTAALTGRYAFRTGIGTSIGWQNPESFQPDPALLTLPERVRRTHHTAAIGKWHLAVEEAAGGDGFMHPIRFGFDQHLGNIEGKLDDYDAFEKNIASAAGHRQVFTRRYATTDEVDDALAVIERLGETPWFVWLAFHAPHSPFDLPPDDLITLNVSESSSQPLKHRALVEAMDTEIGRLLDSIDPAVLARTWIVFMGDNGTAGVALGPLATGKSTVYELGIHVPLIVAGPGVAEPGREVTALVDATDLYATVLDMIGQPPAPQATDSVSFYPHLVDAHAAPARSWSYSAIHRPNGFGPYDVHRRAIRGERYKLIRRLTTSSFPPAVQFFDLWNDPRETMNLFPNLNAEQQAVFDELDAILQTLGG